MSIEDDVRPFKELVELMSKPRYPTVKVAVKWIIKHIIPAVKKTRFFDVLIIGGQGAGKSTLALYILYKYYKDPDKVLENTFFVENQLMEALLQGRREVILFDDAGVTLNKWRAMSHNSVEYSLFQQIVRTKTSSIIYTTVFDNIIKFVRDTVKSYIALHTIKDKKDGSTIVYGSLYENKIKTQIIRKRVMDFVMNINDLHNDPVFHNLYVEYMKRREEFIDGVIKSMLERRRLTSVPETPDIGLPNERLYSVSEVAELLRVSNSTVRYWIYNGIIKAVRIGKKHMIPESELKKITKNLEE